MEIASLLEKLDQQDLLGRRYFRSFPSILRKCADDLDKWKPDFISSRWYNALNVVALVRFATARPYYRHVANLLEVAYAETGKHTTVDASDLGRHYLRYRREFENPTLQNHFRRLLGIT